MAPPPPEAQVRRTRALTALAVAVLVVAGITLGVLDDGKVGILGGFLIGVAIILLVGRVFYEVGLSEDRDRARGRS